jgi:general stress protein 26
MAAARYCSLITVGEDGHPQARIVDPFPPEGELTVWIATNPATRKVVQVRKDRRVTLLYFDPKGPGYVTILGEARLVDDPREKGKRWKPEWSRFYKDENRGADYLLIRIEPRRLEVVSEAHGLVNDPATWRPVTLEFR